MKRSWRLSIMLGDVDLRPAVHLAAEAVLGVLRREADARAAGLQRRRDLLGVVADRGDDAEAGDHDAAHGAVLLQS